MLKGITVSLYTRTESGKDAFNKSIYTETKVDVSDCLVAPVSSEDIINEVNLTGKHLVYEIAIPKGDNHDWRDKKVEFFGQTFHTVGDVTEGIEENIPLRWNKKVKVERYE